MEFNVETSQSLWERFCELQEDYPDFLDPLSNAIAHIQGLTDDALSGSDDWVGIMKRIGLSSNFQSRIMNKDFDRWRYTRSLQEWAII
jgi:hypothetical protein